MLSQYQSRRINRLARYTSLAIPLIKRHTPRMTTTSIDAFRRLPTRAAGCCLHVSSLPGDFGIGELGGAAHEFIDSLARMNIAVWQFLPTGPTAYGDSPYQSLSSFAGNEMLIDVAELLDSGLLAATEADALRDLPRDAVDFARLVPEKTTLLERAAKRFRSQADAEQQRAFDDFRTRYNGPWLHDYARFRVLKRRHGQQPWHSWPAPVAQRDDDALRAFDRDAASEIATIKVLQFLFAQQWQRLREHAAARGIVLFGDLPIYLALDSADVWANPELVRLDDDGTPTHVAGVPPDYFSKDGQLWGNPLYDWPVHEASGFRWWIARLRRTLELADIVRIDHFRGFEAYWSIPAGATTARDGEWLPAPGDAMFGALTEAIGELPIVAEDLGLITPEVEALRDRHGLPGMRVLQFDVAGDDFLVDNIAENCVCYTGTHDNDTALGWFSGGPPDKRDEAETQRIRNLALAATSGTPETIHTDLLDLALSSPARLAMAPLQDYLGLDSSARLNVPGTLSGNWRWRFRGDQLDSSFEASVAARVAAAGRGR